MRDKILVTGGAGYIGSHIVRNLLEKSYQILVLDNLSSGFIKPIEILKKNYSNLTFMKGDLSDKDLLEKLFSKNKIEAVFHLAAKIDVKESVNNPELYFQENFINSIGLVEAMSKAGIKKLIFSSTAAVYGNPEYTPIDERHPTKPLSPYGKTKLDFEKYLAKVENLNFIILRYFNVGGSDKSGLIGKSHLHSQDLIENIMKVALNQKETLEIFGGDYDTKDGTPIRDFVHVEDIAEAHLLALKNIDKFSGQVFNLASEKGFSVKETIETGSKITRKKIKTKITPRREGDVTVSLADASKAKRLLNWNPNNSSIENIIKTDWNWRRDHPLGYTK